MGQKVLYIIHNRAWTDCRVADAVRARGYAVEHVCPPAGDDLPPLEEDVYLRRYTTYGPYGRDGEQASAQLDEASWYDRLRSANTLTITLAGSNFDAVTFDLTRLFGTPLQGEIDECAPSTVRSRTN